MVSETLKIDTLTSKVQFSTKKLGFLTVRGTLSDFSGRISFDKDDVDNSLFEICVSAVTISTDNPKRDEHLKNEDFFFVKNHPSICFKSTSVQKENGNYIAVGKLTILETTKEVSIPFTFNKDIFSGQFSINRFDYDLGKKFPAFVVGKTIQISINCKIK